MSDQVNTTAVVTFQNNMELMLQQTRPLLWDKIKEVSVSGEKAEITDFIGNVKSQKADDRHGDTKYVNTPHDRLWIAKPLPDYYADLVDKDDQIAAKIDIGSGYMMTAVGTINRAKDDAILAAIFGNMITGKNGTTQVPLGTGMAVPVGTGAASGVARMNTSKLIAADELLSGQYVDGEEEKWMVITSKQNTDLLQEIPATSADFKGAYGGTFEKGKIKSLLGWNFIHMELSNPLLWNAGLTVDGSGYRKNPFWVGSGLVKGAWEELFTDITPLPTKRYSKQVYAETIVAATRTQQGKVGYILNSEA